MLTFIFSMCQDVRKYSTFLSFKQMHLRNVVLPSTVQISTYLWFNIVKNKGNMIKWNTNFIPQVFELLMFERNLVNLTDRLPLKSSYFQPIIRFQHKIMHPINVFIQLKYSYFTNLNMSMAKILYTIKDV